MLKNSLTGKKELFSPIEPGKIKMYACGVTTYDHCHIGHAMQAVVFDVIRNYLEFVGYDVTYVRNYTDVDDKIIKRAEEQGRTPLDLSREMIESVDHDMKSLKIRPADSQPKVSEMIPEIISMVETLVEKNAAYSTKSGDVYFRVRSKEDYGKLSNRNPEDMRTGARDIVQGEKEDELDFALWKADTTEGASWQSPWGAGRPGWHIECSAMAKALLGNHFDIHGGGRDLIFPHHENEIAQSEACNQEKYANYWLHSGLMSIDHQKMSKSLGNCISIRDFLSSYPAEVLRLSFLNQNYSSDVDFSKELFKINRSRLLYYYETVVELKEVVSGMTTTPSKASGETLKEFSSDAMLKDFHRAISDDFNFGKAIANINVLMKKARKMLAGKKTETVKTSAKSFLSFIELIAPVIGIIAEEPKQFIETTKKQMLEDTPFDLEQITLKIEQRMNARNDGNWELSDKIRDELIKGGIILKDGTSGTTWTVSSSVE